jgi:hypothetical protein
MKKHNFNVLRAAFEVLGKIYSKLVITRFTAKKNPGLSPRRPGGFQAKDFRGKPGTSRKASER